MKRGTNWLAPLTVMMMEGHLWPRIIGMVRVRYSRYIYLTETATPSEEARSPSGDTVRRMEWIGMCGSFSGIAGENKCINKSQCGHRLSKNTKT